MNDDELSALQQLVIGPALVAAGLVALHARDEIRRRLSRGLGSSTLPSGGVLGFVLFTLPPVVFVAAGSAVFVRGVLRLL